MIHIVFSIIKTTVLQIKYVANVADMAVCDNLNKIHFSVRNITAYTATNFPDLQFYAEVYTLLR